MYGEHLTELLYFALNLSCNGAAEFILINTNTAIRNYTKIRTMCVTRNGKDVFVKHCRNKQQHFYICDDDTLLVKRLVYERGSLVILAGIFHIVNSTVQNKRIISQNA